MRKCLLHSVYDSVLCVSMALCCKYERSYPEKDEARGGEVEE